MALCALTLLMAYVAARAAAAPGPDAELSPKISPQLTSMLASQDEVPVIISLRAEPGAPALTKVRAAQAQQRVLSELNADDVQIRRRYVAVPALAAVVRISAMERLAALPEVEAISPDLPVHADLAEAGPLIGAYAVHTLGYTGAGVTAAVLDTGIDTDHPDLADDLLSENCYLSAPVACPNGMATDSGPGAAEDNHGHGTHVSGIITSNGTVAPVGIAPDAGIRAYKILNGAGNGTFSDILAAYDDIIANHPDVDVINMSLGDGDYYVAGECDGFIPAFTTAVNSTRSMGMVSFAAAGNSRSKSGVGYPACITNIVSVGAVYDANLGIVSIAGCLDGTTTADKVTCFSQSEPALDLLAPGMLITSTYAGGGTAALGGTSMASPMAAGAAALVRQSAPSLTPAQIEARMRETGAPVTDAANGVTTCRVDVYQAVIDDGGPICASSAVTPPVNDAFINGVVMPAPAPYSNSQNTFGATLEANEPRPCGELGNTVWYTFTATSSATVTIDTFGSSYDTVLAAYSGSAFDTLTTAACNDDASSTVQSQIQFVATAGVAYHVQAGGFLGQTGYLTLHASFGPPPTKQPSPGDTDGDGCPDQRENGPNASSGGRRDYVNFWDFFDTPKPGAVPLRDRVADLNDLMRVAGRFGTAGNPATDPLSPPPPTGYHPAYDRTFIGPDPWDLGPANGGIGLNEVYWVAMQFAHNCT